MVSDILCLLECVVGVTINYKTECAVKCVKVVDDIDTCIVVFVPRIIAKLEHVRGHLNKLVWVVELYREVDNLLKTSK